MRTKTFITVLSALSFTLLTASSALAGHGGKHHKEGRGLSSRMIEALQLSEGQAASIQGLEQARQAATTPVHEQLKALKGELRTLWHAASPDRGAILAVHEEISDLKVELVDAGIAFRRGLAATLTPEQQATMAELKAARHDRNGERKAKRARRGKGEGADKAGRKGRKGPRGKRGFGGDAASDSE